LEETTSYWRGHRCTGCLDECVQDVLTLYTKEGNFAFQCLTSLEHGRPPKSGFPHGLVPARSYTNPLVSFQNIAFRVLELVRSGHWHRSVLNPESSSGIPLPGGVPQRGGVVSGFPSPLVGPEDGSDTPPEKCHFRETSCQGSAL